MNLAGALIAVSLILLLVIVVVVFFKAGTESREADADERDPDARR
jgi:uncharacterized protein YoxC